MARVTEAEVRAIISLDDSASLTPYIAAANLLVEEKLVSTGMSVARLTQVELWLSAHFAAIGNPQIQSETVGPAQVTYQQKLGLGLDATMYGQQAIVLDTSGRLGVLNASTGDKPISAVGIIGVLGGD